MRPQYYDVPKLKPCFSCGRSAARLYRIRHDAAGKWDFVCDDCWPQYSRDNPLYAYGGTWKGSRHKTTPAPPPDGSKQIS